MASGLDQFVEKVRMLSHGNQMQLCEFINKSPELLGKSCQELDDVLAMFDPERHFMGYVAVLCAKFNAPTPANDNRYIQVRELIDKCTGENMRLAHDNFVELCHLLTASLIEHGQPIRGVPLLRKAIAKLVRVDSQLTTIHADLCQLCLLAKCFKPALEVLDVDIASIFEDIHNAHASPFDAKYFLTYFYYGGMIYLAVKNLDRALYFFEVAITTPANAVSHIMLEAYKKYILVSLLLHGKVQPLPKYASQVVSRFIKPLSQTYNDLATAFACNSTIELNAIIAKHRDLFVRDQNYGLVKQVSSVLYKKNIQRLTKTFLTLSLADLACRVGLAGPQEAEKYILHMIEDRHIFATINQKDGMVIFRDEPDKYGGPDVLRNLESQLCACMELDRQLLLMDEEIQVNPKYVKKAAGTQEEEQPSKSTYAV